MSRIVELRARLARGEITHEVLVQQALDAAQGPAAAHVFTRLHPQAALAAARHADALVRAGVPVASGGPLAGLPVTVKDLFDVAGEATWAGSALRQEEPAAAPAQADAPTVARLRAAGAAILGKTNMSEFAFSGVGINPHFGTPRNPHDAALARIPGGSSSGAAVSVALGL
ncbi:MAG: amidase family protein, partial [Rubrivivax sp.]